MFEEQWRQRYPEKFVEEDVIFNRINRGDTIFIGSACAEPQFLVQRLIRFVKSHPKAFVDAQVLHIRSLGVAPYATEKFKQNFRHNSFLYRGQHTRSCQQRRGRLYPNLPLGGPRSFSTTAWRRSMWPWSRPPLRMNTAL